MAESVSPNLNLYVNPETRRALLAESRANNISISEYIRYLAYIMHVSAESDDTMAEIRERVRAVILERRKVLLERRNLE